MDKIAAQGINAFRTASERSSQSPNALQIENEELSARLDAQDDLIATQLVTIEYLESQVSCQKAAPYAQVQVQVQAHESRKVEELSKALAIRVEEAEDLRKKLAEAEAKIKILIDEKDDQHSTIVGMSFSQADRLIEALSLVREFETTEAKAFESIIRSGYTRLQENKKTGKLTHLDLVEETAILIAKVMHFLVSKPMIAEPMAAVDIRAARLHSAIAPKRSITSTAAMEILQSHEPEGIKLDRKMALRAMERCAKNYAGEMILEHEKYKQAKLTKLDLHIVDGNVPQNRLKMAMCHTRESRNKVPVKKTSLPKGDKQT